MSFIVPDEQRSNGPNSARPEGVAHPNTLECVRSLARVPDPRCMTFLPSLLGWAIMTPSHGHSRFP